MTDLENQLYEECEKLIKSIRTGDSEKMKLAADEVEDFIVNLGEL